MAVFSIQGREEKCITRELICFTGRLRLLNSQIGERFGNSLSRLHPAEIEPHVAGDRVIENIFVHSSRHAPRDETSRKA
jgi:hypothetical protein